MMAAPKQDAKDRGHHPIKVMALFCYRSLGGLGHWRVRAVGEVANSPEIIRRPVQLMKIAYQGEPGAFSEAAARQISADASSCPAARFEDVFDAVKAGPAAYGVLPIENSIGGSIHRNFDLLLEHHLPIVGEVELRVEHHLLALPGCTMERVRRIYSHPQALAQCDRFLRTLAGVEVIATYDTAGSAKLIADEQMDDAAAIASARAAEVFGLAPLQVVDSGLRAQRHAVPGHRPPAAVGGAARQDDARVLARQRAGRALQGARACSRCAASI